MKRMWNNGTVAVLWRPCNSARRPFVVCVRVPSWSPACWDSRWGLTASPSPRVCLAETHLLHKPVSLSLSLCLSTSL